MEITDVFAARGAISEAQRRAASRGISLRRAPPKPTTCCSRGCNGCVWEGYFGAVQFWLEDTQAAVAEEDECVQRGAGTPGPDARV